MNKFTDETPIAMLTVGQLKEILGIDRILGNGRASNDHRGGRASDRIQQGDDLQIYERTKDTVSQAGAWRTATLLSARGDPRLVAERITPDDRTGKHPENKPIKKALVMKDEKTTTKPAFDPEVPPREGFIFYRTFYEALASMKNRARLHLYDVIMRYALYGEEPTDLNGEQMRTFILIRPQLDANERKRQAKYKKKAIKKNNGEELNEFFTKTEDEENDNLQILNDIQYK